jgi:hypothetical protein
MSLSVTVQETPNPNARRFLVDRPVQEDPHGRFFTAGDQGADPLARAVMQVGGVAEVMLLPNSITVNKIPSASWVDVEAGVREALGQYFA